MNLGMDILTVVIVFVALVAVTECKEDKVWHDHAEQEDINRVARSVEGADSPDIHNVMEKRPIMTPWEIMSRNKKDKEEEKRFTPWEIMNKQGKREDKRSTPWYIMGAKKSTPWEIMGSKRSTPWQIMGMGKREEEKRFTPWEIMNKQGKRGDDEDEKRAMSPAGRKLVTFQCSRKTASCKNGGKGPRVTFIKGGNAVCTCMCPFGYHEPQCGESWWNSKENGVKN